MKKVQIDFAPSPEVYMHKYMQICIFVCLLIHHHSRFLFDWGFFLSGLSLKCFTTHRWQEALTVYPRTNKQNQKKKRKVDPPTQQVMIGATLPNKECFLT